MSIKNKKELNKLVQIIKNFEDSLKLLQKIHDRDRNNIHYHDIQDDRLYENVFKQQTFIQNIKSIIKLYKRKLDDFNQVDIEENNRLIDRIAKLEIENATLLEKLNQIPNKFHDELTDGSNVPEFINE